MTSPVVELRNVSKHFGGTDALHDVSFAIFSGQVHCLLGDNGAGKSTLIKTISGVHQPNAGEVFIDGELIRMKSPRDAFVRGIAAVQQSTQGIPLMSVARNFFLGAEPVKGRGPLRRFDHKKAENLALENLRRMGLTGISSGSQPVGTLSGGERQALAISRAMYFGARVLILDEPTSALGVKEAEFVLRLVRRTRREGVAVIFITHNVQHAMAVGDAFTILIKGEVAARFERGEKTRDEVLSLMAGGEDFAALVAGLDDDTL
jgi:simple sugar transport system ATP-binding protein